MYRVDMPCSFTKYKEIRDLIKKKGIKSINVGYEKKLIVEKQGFVTFEKEVQLLYFVIADPQLYFLTKLGTPEQLLQKIIDDEVD